MSFIVILSIIIVGFFLRVWNISNIPLGFFCDEASIGYNAYSLLQTGKDEFGVSFPIFFQSFGDYRPPLGIYSTIPFIALFGLNEISTRFMSVFYGVLAIPFMYLLGKQIGGTKTFGLLTAFISATMPWLIHYNRTGFEFSIYSTFFIATVFLFVKASHHKFFILPAFFVSALTLYTYQPAKLLIPLLLVGVLIIYRKIYFVHKKELTLGLFLFFIISLPIFLSLIVGEGVARFNMISVFSGKLSFSETIFRIFQNYVTQLSPSYFLKGEPTFITRHFIHGLTPLLMITLPFLLIGIVHTFFTIRKKTSQLLVYWLFIYPIAGAVTLDAPFTSRAIIGAALFSILISSGIAITAHYGKRFIKNGVSIFIIVTMILINLGIFVRFYFYQYPLYSSDFWGWQYGAKDIVTYFKNNQDEYDELIMAPVFNAPHIFFKFYAPNNCQKCKIGLPHEMYKSKSKQLYAVTPIYLQAHPELLFVSQETIYYPNNTVAFHLGQIRK